MLAAFYLSNQHALRLLSLHRHQPLLHIRELFLAVLIDLNGEEVLDLELQLFCLQRVYDLMAKVVAIVCYSFFAFLLLLVLAIACLQDVGFLVNASVLYHVLDVDWNHLIRNYTFLYRYKSSCGFFNEKFVVIVDEQTVRSFELLSISSNHVNPFVIILLLYLIVLIN